MGCPNTQSDILSWDLHSLSSVFSFFFLVCVLHLYLSVFHPFSVKYYGETHQHKQPDLFPLSLSPLFCSLSSFLYSLCSVFLFCFSLSWTPATSPLPQNILFGTFPLSTWGKPPFFSFSAGVAAKVKRRCSTQRMDAEGICPVCYLASVSLSCPFECLKCFCA